jgi:hypothetical protein
MKTAAEQIGHRLKWAQRHSSYLFLKKVLPTAIVWGIVATTGMKLIR